MNDVCNNLNKLKAELATFGATLIAVSKTKPIEEIKNVYACGQIDFGENYVQELVEKQKLLPDCRWHFIGHLQSNKVKYIAPFVHLIHAVDNEKLLIEINKQAHKNNRVINVLLQIYIAKEETKFGLSYEEAATLLQSTALAELKNICIKGLMAIASNTDNLQQVHNEFHQLKLFFEKIKMYATQNFKPEILSTGMSGDYKIAMQEGSTMVRIGSLIFGERNYTSL